MIKEVYKFLLYYKKLSVFLGMDTEGILRKWCLSDSPGMDSREQHGGVGRKRSSQALNGKRYVLKNIRSFLTQ